MTSRLDSFLDSLRSTRWANLAVVNLRILVGFALVPSGLKKVIDEPFTDPDNVGTFHEFLHVFHATGGFYHFVGSLQLAAAVLLFTQRFATVGALILAPIMTAITVFCWSTAVYPTAIVSTLIWLATVGLLVWDFHKWRGVFVSDHRDAEIRVPRIPPVIDTRLWQRCGTAILFFYLFACALSGEIYRPRGIELDNPAFYILPVLPLFPVVTLILDRVRYRRRLAELRRSSG